jgi:hypothetical protein
MRCDNDVTMAPPYDVITTSGYMTSNAKLTGEQ